MVKVLEKSFIQRRLFHVTLTYMVGKTKYPFNLGIEGLIESNIILISKTQTVNAVHAQKGVNY